MANKVDITFRATDLGLLTQFKEINAAQSEIVRTGSSASGSLDRLEARFRTMTTLARQVGVEMTPLQLENLRAQGLPTVEKMIAGLTRMTEASRQAAQAAIGIQAPAQAAGDPLSDVSLERKSAMLDELRLKARALGIEFSSAQLDAVFKKSETEIRNNIRALDDLIKTERDLKLEQQQRAALQARLAETQFRSIQRESSVSFKDSLPARDRVVARNFDQAAREIANTGSQAERTIERVGASASRNASRLEQMTKHTGALRISLLSLAGAGHVRGIEQLENIVQKGAALSGVFTLGIGTLAALGVAAVHWTSKIREEAENALKRVSESANRGLTGGKSELVDELEKLQKIKRDIAVSEKSPTDVLKAGGFEGSSADLANKITVLEARLKRLNEIDGTAAEERRKKEQQRAETRRQEDEEDIRRAEQIIEQERRQNDLTRQAAQSVTELSRLVDRENPFVGLFDEATARLDRFRERFAELGPEILNQFRQINNQVLSLDVFKAQLAGAERLSQLLTRETALSSGQEFEQAEAARRLEFAKRQADLLTQTREIEQGFKFDEAQRAREQVRRLVDTPGLAGANLARAIEEATRGLNIAQLEEVNLLQQRRAALLDIASEERAAEAFRKEPAEVTVARDFLARAQAIFDQSLLNPSFNAEQGQAALDRLASSVLGRISPAILTPDLRERELDATRRAIERETAQAFQAERLLDEFHLAVKEFTRGAGLLAEPAQVTLTINENTRTPDLVRIERLGTGDTQSANAQQ